MAERMEFRRAVKSAAKLRLLLAGASGGGKTYTALAIGRVVGPRMGVIDSERGSAALYADEFEFAHLDLPNHDPETYLDAIESAAAARLDPLVIDSWSHAWENLKERVDGIAQASYRGNVWAAWSELTPIQNQLVTAIISYPGHVIATVRSKTQWEVSKDDKGRSRPQKVGLAPIQREGVDYEFSVHLTLSNGGAEAKVEKSRWSELKVGRVMKRPGEAFARGLLGWLGTEGAAPRPASNVTLDPRPTTLADVGRAVVETVDAPGSRRLTTPAEALAGATQPANGGIVHRDLKPENVLAPVECWADEPSVMGAGIAHREARAELTKVRATDLVRQVHDELAADATARAMGVAPGSGPLAPDPDRGAATLRQLDGLVADLIREHEKPEAVVGKDLSIAIWTLAANYLDEDAATRLWRETKKKAKARPTAAQALEYLGLLQARVRSDRAPVEPVPAGTAPTPFAGQQPEPVSSERGTS